MSKRQRACPEQATTRRIGRMLIPLTFLRLASNLNRDPFNRPAGTGYFPHDSRHFVPGWPFGPAGFDILGRPKGENSKGNIFRQGRENVDVIVRSADFDGMALKVLPYTCHV